MIETIHPERKRCGLCTFFKHKTKDKTYCAKFPEKLALQQHNACIRFEKY